jgi:hypothetical protein
MAKMINETKVLTIELSKLVKDDSDEKLEINEEKLLQVSEMIEEFLAENGIIVEVALISE